MGNKHQYRYKFIIAIVSLILLSFSSYSFANSKQKLLKAADTDASGEYVRARFLKQVKKPFNLDDSRKKLLLIGDSHAQDFYNVLAERHVPRRYQISNRYIPNVCQMYLGDEDVNQFIEKKNAAVCSQADTLAQAKPQIAQADIIILSSNWKEWSAKRLPKSIKNLQLTPEQTLIVIGRKSFGKPNIRKYLRMPKDKLKTITNPVDEHQVAINRLMKKNIPEDIFIDVQSLVCKSPDVCRVFTENAELISFDGGHLTPDGAKYMGNILFEHAPLKNLLVSGS